MAWVGSATHKVRARLTDASSWRLPKQTSTLAPPHVWSNSDMDPVPPEKQTWNMWTWMGYWASDAINIGTWEAASSIIAVGLTWRDAIPIVVVGTSSVAVPMVLNGSLGARLHIPFSVAVRAGFGYYLAYYCIVSRAVLAAFWLGIQSVSGSQCITIMLRAIWPSYGHLSNSLPSSAGIDTQGMVSYFIFWLIQMPLLLVPPQKLKWLFLAKIIVAPITALAMLGWCVNKAGGSGTIFSQPATVSGSERAWLWISCMTSITGSWSTMACNIADFSRYSQNRTVQYIQLPFIPFIFTICSVLGIITTSAGYAIWGEYYWNPLDILGKWLEMGSGGRAAAFFAACAWFIVQVGSNITSNCISAANDLTVLFPRYVNIRRGCIITALAGGWVFVPWKILASASSFLSFMGGYAVFLGPIAGILVSDYWLVRRQKVDVPAMYDPNGRYHYWHGINWRALLALLVSSSPNLPGLAYSINSSTVSISEGSRHLYSFNWLFGFTTSVFLYYALSLAFPPRDTYVSKTIFGFETIAAVESTSYVEDQDDGGQKASPVSEKGVMSVM
ncbi:NCS1 nucleoside transporter family [Pleurostoma richardsiae]|uniref:NCS1 nucleoside transporter family n=1 Tax=Pleurostoma richardsiae TaxID=41990 RepID=A0AA38VIZ4_9PEZI|nr:NCS1 nucleoside transporter family [Pleurostoma richardsiae]